MKVTINVCAVRNSKQNKNSASGRNELLFTLVFPCANEDEAGDLAQFAIGKFSLANTRTPSDWLAGIRMGYIGLMSAQHCEENSIHIEASITGK